MPIPGDVDVRSGFGIANAVSDENAAQTRARQLRNQRNISLVVQARLQVCPTNIDRHSTKTLARSGVPPGEDARPTVILYS